VAHQAELPNPFSTRRIRPGAVTYQFVDAREHLEVVRACRRPANLQIIGPHGSGKTTLMKFCLANLKVSGWDVHAFRTHDLAHKLTWSAVRSLKPARRTVIAVDGYETIGWFKRKRLEWFCRHREWRLMVTGHRDLGMPCGFVTKTHPLLLRQVVHRVLLQWCHEVEMDASRAVWLLNLLPDLNGLFEELDGNLRDVLFALYDWFESKRPVHSDIKACANGINGTNVAVTSNLPMLRGSHDPGSNGVS